MENPIFILQDKYLFYIIESIILILLLISISIDLIKKRRKIIVKRGRKSLRKINNFFFIITAFGIIELTINTARSFKILFCLFNISTFIYLTFFNSWFRNLIIGVVNKFENKLENH